MSRQEQFNTKSNPATLRLTWKSSEKRFVAYNTITKEKQTLGDISFIVLTKTVSICGFNEPQNLGIFSNEIKNTQNEELIVRTKNGVLVQGMYNDIKGKMKLLGASFANNLYVRLKTGETAILQLSGAALKIWFEYEELNKGKIGTHWVTITGINDLKKGAVKYTVPVLTLGNALTTEEDAQAEEDYKAVVEYRKANDKPKSIEDLKTDSDDDTSDDDGIDEIPY